MVLISLLSIYSYLKDVDNPNSSTFLTISIITMLIGISICFNQLRRLKYKTFKLTKSQTEFKENTRILLENNKWDIEYDNQNYIQATYRGSLFNLDVLTLRFKKNEIQWNVINHPNAHNPIAASLSLNIPGKKMIKKIIASV